MTFGFLGKIIAHVLAILVFAETNRQTEGTKIAAQNFKMLPKVTKKLF